MTLAPQILALMLAVTFVAGVLVGGVISLSVAMHAIKHAEKVR